MASSSALEYQRGISLHLACILLVCSAVQAFGQDEASNLQMFTSSPVRSGRIEPSQNANPLRNKAVELNQEGVELYFKGKRRKALGKIKQALAHDPQNTEILYNLSGFYLAEGNAKGAVPVIDHALRSNPGDDRYLRRLAESYVALDRISSAIKVYEQIIDQQPENGEVLFRLGTLYGAEKRWEEAERTLTEAKKFLGHDLRLLKNLGTILIAGEKYQSAVQVLTQAMKKKPSIETAVALGIANESLGRSKEAVKCYREAIDLGEDEPKLKEHIAELERISADGASQD